VPLHRELSLIGKMPVMLNVSLFKKVSVFVVRDIPGLQSVLNLLRPVNLGPYRLLVSGESNKAGV